VGFPFRGGSRWPAARYRQPSDTPSVPVIAGFGAGYVGLAPRRRESSAGASAAYLTVSEIFPMETRAMAIAFFYATGTIVGGLGGPLLFGALIQSGDRGQIFIGYLVGAIVMIVGGVIQAVMGVEAAGRDLEDIAPPLSAAGDELEEPGEVADPYTVAAEEGRRQAPAAEPRFEREPATDREPPPEVRT
jgi:MFS family permease